MKTKFIIGVTAFGLLIAACANKYSWHETQAIIHSVQEMDNGEYSYSITYQATETTAKTPKGVRLQDR